MQMILAQLFIAASLVVLTTSWRATMSMTSLYDFKLKDMAGVEQSLSKYSGKVVLLENVASL